MRGSIYGTRHKSRSRFRTLMESQYTITIYSILLIKKSLKIPKE